MLSTVASVLGKVCSLFSNREMILESSRIPVDFILIQNLLDTHFLTAFKILPSTKYLPIPTNFFFKLALLKV